MNLISHGGLSGFRDSIREHLRDRKIRRDRLVDIQDAVEQVVDGTDGRIRLVRGYQKKLHEAVYTALGYADDLVDQIPQAIEVNRSTFTSNDHVNAFFVDFADLVKVFSRSSELQEFLHDYRDNDIAECCALLCMHKTEKTVMGMELSGDMLKKEVTQVAVSFSDYLLYSPAPSEFETRAGLKQCLFQGLVTNALERIVRLKLDSQRLQDMRQMLNARLLHLQHKPEAEDRGGAEVAADIAQTRRELNAIDKELMALPQATPQQSLEHVQDVFSRPDQFVSFSKYALKLSKLGIRIDQDSTQSCNRLELISVTVGDAMPRVITLVKFPTEELLARNG